MNKAYIYVIITALLFGTMEVACKIGGADMDPYQLTFLRFLIGGLILLPFALKQMKNRGVRPEGRDILLLAAIGFVGVTVSMSMFQFSVMLCNASTVSVLFCVNPFFTMVFAHLLTDEKIYLRKAVILVVALAGIFFMLRHWDVQEGNTLPGMLLMIVAAMFFGIYTVMAKESQRKLGPVAQTSISFLLGAGILLIAILIMGRPVIAGTADNIPIIIYTGVMVTGLGYYCYFRAIELADAATGSFAFFLKPAIAPVIAVIVLHETILWNTVAGIALVLIASLLKILGDRKDSGR
ncbi:MAG: DMT family transporter [Bacillota bacterium]